MKQVTISFVLSLLMFNPLALAVTDKKGSSDHELISRYPGFYIKDYSYAEYDEAEIINGPLEIETKTLPALSLEGEVSNILYKNSSQSINVSVFQLFKNYENALKKLNAEFVFKCRGKRCYKEESKSSGNVINAKLRKEDLIYKGLDSTIKEEFGIMSAKIKIDSSREVYVMICVSAHNSINQRLIAISIIEPAVLNSDVIGIGSVEDLKDKIKRSGKVELEGVYFDSDLSVIKEESMESLKTIAGYLNSETEKKFYVVGHTDNNGSYEHNVRLSLSRAQAVLDTLTKKYQVKTGVLSAHGVGPVSPAQSNLSDEGQKANRRVELVLKNGDF
ncbi:MAG: OmpA family protein [Gammaproteobacteria bacterium]|nr:OmpA family protein [Gammaproteobacteria bacterium]